MKKLIHLFLLFLLVLASTLRIQAQDYAFQPGEKVTYNIAYRVLGIYVKAGSATFTTAKADYPSGNVYHLVGEGATNSRYDWIFKVRDRYESYFDASTMQPIKAVRDVSEGKYKKYEEVVFNNDNNTVTTKKGSIKVPAKIQDVISSVYYLRNIDFSRYKTGDKIPFNMFLGNDVYGMYIRYNGIEKIKTNYGTFEAIRLQPMLLKGDTFKSEDDMTVWITNDNNHLPLRIESKLRVGSIRVDLSSHQNLKYPLLLASR